jgi:hypothetical protein
MPNEKQARYSYPQGLGKHTLPPVLLRAVCFVLTMPMIGTGKEQIGALL